MRRKVLHIRIHERAVADQHHRVRGFDDLGGTAEFKVVPDEPAFGGRGILEDPSAEVRRARAATPPDMVEFSSFRDDPTGPGGRNVDAVAEIDSGSGGNRERDAVADGQIAVDEVRAPCRRPCLAGDHTALVHNGSGVTPDIEPRQIEMAAGGVARFDSEAIQAGTETRRTRDLERVGSSWKINSGSTTDWMRESSLFQA